jgi:hypothetical protein
LRRLCAIAICSRRRSSSGSGIAQRSDDLANDLDGVTHFTITRPREQARSDAAPVIIASLDDFSSVFLERFGMGLREKLNSSKKLGMGVGIGFLLLSMVMLYFALRDDTPAALEQGFFTVDDGKTYFADDIKKVAPFQHEGKEAVRAYVYEQDGKKTVAYLERFTPAAKPRMEELIANNDGTLKAQSELGQFLMENPAQIKRPGDQVWLPSNTNEGMKIRTVAGTAVYP